MMSLRAYVTIRVALAKQVLSFPDEPRHREAYDEIKELFLRQYFSDPNRDAEPLPDDYTPALLKRQAE